MNIIQRIYPINLYDKSNPCEFFIDSSISYLIYFKYISYKICNRFYSNAIYIRICQTQSLSKWITWQISNNLRDKINRKIAMAKSIK